MRSLSLAGKSWSKKELQTSDVRPELLVVVVGELLSMFDTAKGTVAKQSMGPSNNE